MKRFLTALVLSSLACSGAHEVARPKPPTAAHASGPTACERAKALRARLPKLLDEGKIDRTVRAAKRAEELCGDGAATAWAPLLTALADLGRDEEARALAKTIEQSAEAPSAAKKAAAEYRARVEPPAESGDLEAIEAKAEQAATAGDHAAAKESFLAVWRRSRPNGRALVEAGRQAEAMKDAPAAQRLFDRALVELEREAGKPARAVTVASTGRLRWNRSGTRFAIDGGFGDEQVLFLGRWSSSGPVLERAVEGVAQSLAASFDFLPGDRSIVATNGSELTLIDLESGVVTPVDEAGLYYLGEDNKTLYFPSSSGRAGIVAFDLEARAPIATSEAPAVIDRPVTVGYLKLAHRLYASSDGVYVYDSTLKPIIKGDNLAAWAFSDDEAILATLASEPPVLSFYEVATGKLLKAVPLVPDETSVVQGGLAFTHDRKTIALMNRAGPLLLVDVKSGRVRPMPMRAEGEETWLWTMSFTADNKRLCGVVEATQRPTCVLDIGSGRWLTGAKNTASLVGFGKQHAVAVTMPANAEGAIGPEVDGVADSFALPVLSPDEKTMLVDETSADGSVTHIVGIDVAAKKTIFTTTIDEAALGGGGVINVGPDGRSAVVLLASTTVVLAIPSGKILARLPRGSDLFSFEYRDDGKVVAIHGMDNATEIVDLATGAVHRLSNVSSGGVATAISPDGGFAYVRERDGAVTVWDLGKASARKSFTPPAALNNALLDPGGKRIAMWAGATARLVDASDGTEPVQLAQPAETLTAMAFDPKGVKLYGAISSGGIHVWNPTTGEIETTLLDAAHHRGAHWLAFDPTGHFLSATQEKMSELWDLEGGTLVRSGERSGPTAFSHDGQLLAIGRELLDFHSGQVALSLDSKVAPSAVAFTLDNASALFSTNEVFTMSTASGAVSHRASSAVAEASEEEDAPAAPIVNEEVTQFAPRASGRSVTGLLRNGEIGLFANDLRLRARFTPVARGAAYVTTDTGALELLGDAKDAPSFICVVGTTLLPFEVCSERLLSPGLLGRALEGDDALEDP